MGNKSSDPKTNKRKSGDSSASSGNDSWKKKLKKAIKSRDGISHVMSVLAEEESINDALISGLRVELPPTVVAVPPPTPLVAPPTAPVVTSNNYVISALSTAFPALSTRVKLNSILKSPILINDSFRIVIMSILPLRGVAMNRTYVLNQMNMLKV